MDYPTEEELAEFHGLAVLPPTQPSQSQVHTPNVNKDSHSFFHNNSLLSQIPVTDKTTSDIYPNNNVVNRCLFGSPMPGTSSSILSNRISSTPIGSITAGPSNPYANRFDDHDLDINNGHVEVANPRKRRLDDLFGDIGDIIDDEDLANVYYGFDTEENEKKKARNEEELDRALIEKILLARAMNRAMASNHTKQTKLEQLEALQKFKMRNLSETYPIWPSIPVLGDGRERLYVRMHSEEFETNQLKELNFRKSFNNLLGESSESVWNEAQSIVQKRMIETVPISPDDSPIITDVALTTGTNKLWVDKYRPNGYFDLLSDESTNRSLLTWLKMWDKMVFKKEFKTETYLSEAQKHSASNFNKRTGKFEVGGVRFRKGRHSDLKTEIDSHGRPVQKIAVLCGPPGLGKTTLAHTIARHAGYAVREINASDDRSPDCFRLALQNGTEMQTTMMNQEHRPNCIVLDEIDGAPTASIDFLIRFINDQPKESSNSKNAVAPKIGSKPVKSKSTGILRRPIICICNDIYTPSLRALRQIAFIVTFPPLESSRLAERLLSIARKERLKTDMTALLALVDKSGNDVRSCISVLQFYGNNRKPLTLVEVMSSNIGQKDRQKGLFDMWTAIFQIQRPKHLSTIETKTNSNDAAVQNVAAPTEMSLKNRVENVLGVTHMGGDQERLINGVYENYLSQKMPDANLIGITQATDWFCFTDQLQTLIHSQQIYSIYPYLQHGFAMWHILFASLAWPKIIFPSQGYEFHQKSSLQKSIRAAFIKNISAMTRSLANNTTIISEAIGSIRQIICPSLRSVSLQLLTPKERSDLQHTVQVMADLGLTYSQLKSLDGTYQYQIEPDINTLCNLKVAIRSNELTYSNMQIIAREVEMEVMRRATPRQAITDNKKKADNIKNRILQTSNKPNHLQRLVCKPIVKGKMKETITKDFFGRLTEKRVALSVQEGGSDLIVKSPIWYRYKEGFNNAVRKDITIKNLL